MKHLLYLGVVSLTSLGFVACDSTVAPESNLAPASNTAAASMIANRGSWNGWHVHDLPYDHPNKGFTDENGLRHEDYDVWGLIWGLDYPSAEYPVVYCIDGAEKALVGGVGGSKPAAGTCRNDLYIIQIKVNDSDAPGPGERSGWTEFPLPPDYVFTLYYRLTAR